MRLATTALPMSWRRKFEGRMPACIRSSGDGRPRTPASKSCHHASCLYPCSADKCARPANCSRIARGNSSNGASWRCRYAPASASNCVSFKKTTAHRHRCQLNPFPLGGIPKAILVTSLVGCFLPLWPRFAVRVGMTSMVMGSTWQHGSKALRRWGGISLGGGPRSG